MSEKDLQRAIEAMLRDERPPKGSLTPDEAAALRAAARLRAAHPGASNPTPEFVDSLARRLRQPQTSSTSRRHFIRGAGLAAAAAVIGVAGDRVVNQLTDEGGQRPAPQSTELVPWAGTWQAVTTLSELEGRPVVRFSVGAVTGFVIKRSGAIVAMSAVCTHQGCILDAASDSSHLVCPCHAQTFALDGNPNPGDYYLTPLPRIRSRVNGDAVEVFV